MAIWLNLVIVAAFLFDGSNSNAQELVKVPVQILSISPAVTAFAVARERGYYRQEELDQFMYQATDDIEGMLRDAGAATGI